ncbi:cation:proton antiporter [Eilatimonas milleporae]|uniref:Transporter (CPA2 family) n=1 Tax=Eilatimonas milleporae TaxID=911205 RepID=A0A3M0CQX7_9PROT|nr:cation:proton antiporter [Eilatimonas milleporae]RMB11974.1 transporter (CPA2 family) [Eilatimonas milleporae]
MHTTLLAFGGLLIVGLAADAIGRRTRLPRVTLLILFGLAAGPAGFDLLPDSVRGAYGLLTTVALTMVAFLLGGRLSARTLGSHGRDILIVSAVVTVATAAIVGGGLILAGTPLAMALLLGGIATATDPAATQDVVRQTGAKGPFTDTLLGIVALDDVWGVILFSLLLAAARTLSPEIGPEIGPEIAVTTAGDGSGWRLLAHGLWEVGGAVLAGSAVGLPGAYLTGRIRRGEPMLLEALGLVFLCAGLATWLGVSFLLTGMVAGSLIVNLARHHNRPFHAIERIEWPFMVLFFILAGAALHPDSLLKTGLFGAAFILLRMAARLLGGWLGGTVAGVGGPHRLWIGAALFPQAGVALGMALVAGEHMPDLAETLLPLTIGATIIFELVGPLMTQRALGRVGESRR